MVINRYLWLSVLVAVFFGSGDSAASSPESIAEELFQIANQVKDFENPGAVLYGYKEPGVDRELRRKLRSFWRTGKRKFVEATPHVAELYIKEEDPKIRFIVAQAYYEIVSMVNEHPSLRIAMEKPLLKMTNHEEDPKVVAAQIDNLDGLFSGAKPHDIHALTKVLSEHLNECRATTRVINMLLVHVARNEPQLELLVVDLALEMIQKNDCEEGLLAFTTYVGRIRSLDPERVDKIVRTLIEQNIESGNQKIAGILIYKYTSRSGLSPSEAEWLYPLIRVALESSNHVLACNATDGARRWSGLQPSELPYASYKLLCPSDPKDYSEAELQTLEIAREFWINYLDNK